MMAAAAAGVAVNGPPPMYPAPLGGTFPFQPYRGAAPPDPGALSQPQQPAFTRPVFYLPTPHPPPMFQYQWPMPFSYNPFTGFPGMGYGMVMPPFPPPSFIEPPAYVIPHPHMQPPDCRRYPNPPGVPHLNPNPARRDPTPAATIPVRETMSREVQTEPPQQAEGGYMEACSDSGQGTAASNSPSPSSSSSQKRDSVGNRSADGARSSQENQPSTVKPSSTALHKTVNKSTATPFLSTTQESQMPRDGVVQEPPVILAFQSSHFNMGSDSSPDSMVPVCSASQTKDEVCKERYIFVPDILTLEMADETLTENDPQLPDFEPKESHETFDQCLAKHETGNLSPICSDDDNDEGISRSNNEGVDLDPVPPPPTPLEELSHSKREDPEELAESLRCSLAYGDEEQHSLNSTQNPHENEQEETNLNDTAEMALYCISSSFQQRRKMNESVWSVESLEPFIPNKEWFIQNAMIEAEVILEMEEITATLNRNNNLFVKQTESGQTQQCLASNPVPVLDSIAFSIPSEKPRSPKMPRMESPDIAGKPVASPPPNPPQSETVATLTETLVEEVVSKEDLYQGLVGVTEQKEQSPESPESETFLLNSAAEKMSAAAVHLSLQNGPVEEDQGLGEVSQRGRDELSVPTAAMKLAEVLPSKSMDFGIQCTDLCDCGQLKVYQEPKQVHPTKVSDCKKANYEVTEHGLMDGRPPKNSKRGNAGRNRNQGGTGRVPRC